MRKRRLLLLILLFIPTYLPNPLFGYQRETKAYLLERCRECRLYLTNQKEIRGELIFLGENYLEIAVREAPLTKQFQHQSHKEVIPMRDVHLMRCGDPTYDGVIWGFLAGAFIGATYLGMKYNMLMEPGYEYDYSASDKALKGLLVGGAIGMVLGYFLDMEIGYPQETMSIQEWLGEEGSEFTFPITRR